MADFKITMLGTTGSGKTCFMLGMYSIMQVGQKGFTFLAKNDDDDLYLSDTWEALVEDKEWPVPSFETKSYEFSFGYALRELVSFEWLDYRGGALKDVSSAEDVQALKLHMSDSSGCLCCIPGHFIRAKALNSFEDRDKDVARSIPRMNKFILDSRINKPNFPVVIVVTKSDECKDVEKDTLIDIIQNLFNSLFTVDGNWCVAICPVTLGEDLKGVIPI